MAGNYKNLTANASTLLAKQPAKLKSVTINTKGAASNTLKLFDNAAGDSSGTLIATIDTTGATTYLPYDVLTQVGLSAVMATGTPADVTVAWE